MDLVYVALNTGKLILEVMRLFGRQFYQKNSLRQMTHASGILTSSNYSLAVVLFACEFLTEGFDVCTVL